MQINTIYAQQCGLGEGAYWHPQEEKLYWIDIKYKRIHNYDPKTKQVAMWQLPGIVTAICACEKGGLLIGFEDKIAHFNTQNNAIKILFDAKSGLRMNDGLTDPAGRFWIGQADDEFKGRARLFRYDPDGSCRVMEEGLTISNGLDWDLQRKRFYLADSPLGVIYAFDYAHETGSISNRREFIRIDTNEGFPDGFILDNEGCLWCCLWDGFKINRYAPSGALLHSIKMPVKRPTKCVFGGPEFKTLFITSASSNITSDEQLDSPNGYVFSIDVDAQGNRLTPFG